MSGILSRLLGSAAAAAITDAYFNLVTLLLNTTATNGAQNNTFLDSSTNNFSITRNGNTTQGTFTPFSQTGWGAFNVGTASYCQLNNSDYSISTGDFTIEFFMFVTSDKASTCFCSATSNPNLTVSMGGGSAGARQPYLEYGGSGTSFTAFSNYLNTWTHVAFVRSSGTVTVYQNGVALSSTSKSAAVGTTANLYLLRNSGDANQDFPGYISNFRICKAAVYTGNFTPTTTNFTTTSQSATSCQLLTFQDNRFLDNSSNASTVTPTLTQVQAFSPFLPTTAYSDSVVGGSGYFDGNGDYLTAPNNAVFDFGSGDFTIEFWVYSNGDNEYMPVEKTINGQYGSWYLQVTSGSLNWNCSSTGSSNDMFNNVNVGAVPIYAWTHIAIVRNGTTFTGYINGVGTSLGTNSSAIYNSSYGITVGAHNGTSSYDLNGYIAGLRLIKGTAAYTSNFTPPTAPPTAITNTSLLLNFTNSGIFDSAAKNVMETDGNAQVSTTTAQWGTTSIYLPGSAAFVGIPSSPNLDFGTGDFTVECWVNSSSSGTNYPSFIGSVIGWSAGASGHRFNNTSATNKFTFHLNGAGDPFLTSTNTFSLGTWYHYALTRSGNTWRMFINGALEASGTYAGSFNQALGGIRLGYSTWDGAQGYYIGYIDDLRITKGYARYTASFTAPTAAFPLQ